ncbi:kinesin, putative [Leishmania tarentolae]|uniref:Kinesin, putative n=1 Tax=Leishmania tarentolae TaxID=5689 RepID=A0A640KDL1_LEITA|nr:kinesin, putative [Leishmania tarentolae]
MEFKRSNSSRGPLAPATRVQSVKSARDGTTPLRSAPPLKPPPSHRAPPLTPDGETPPRPPSTAAVVSARQPPRKESEDANASFQRTNSTTPTKPPKPSQPFERSASGTGSRGAFKRSATAAGMRRAEVIKHNNRVNVYVRVRAFREDETSGDMGQLAVNMDDGAVEVTVPKKGRFTFGFDGCFWSNDRACPSGKASASQEDVFDEVGRPLVENALAGYNAAVMAYGQTGSGKTYTSFGPPGSIGTSQEGLIPRVCNMIFARAASSAQKGVTYTVSASMLEVYLEDVFDLLNHRKQLSVRNDFTNNTFSVVGQKTVPVKSYKDVLAVLNKAEPLRTFAATNIHDHSSRAHTLFMLEVQTHFDAPDLAPRCAKILLADLAGCERIRLAGTEEGLAFEQARNINLSLLALGSCIEAVATRGRTNSRSIPEFRNSTLTKLLKDYIGGNSISTMMVTISPSERDANLSVQTLRFADRAKQITTHAHVNTVDSQQTKQDECELGDRWRDEYLRKKEALYAEYQLKGTIEKLLARIAELEARLREGGDDELALHLTTEIEGLQKALTEADYQMGLQRQILYGEFLMLEDELREMNTKMQEMKEEHEEAMEGLLGEETGRFEEMKRGYETRLRALQSESDAALAVSADEIAALRRLVAELQERLAAKETECADLSDRLRALQAKYDADTSAAEQARSELEAQLDAMHAMFVQHESTALELRNRAEEREQQHATVEAQLEVSEQRVKELTDREEQLVREEDTLRVTLEQLTEDLSSTHEKLQETSAKLAETEEKLQETSAKLADTEEALQETNAKLGDTEETLQETSAKLAETEEKLQETSAKLAETEETLQETSAKLAGTEETLQETSAKLAETEETLQETSAKLAETEEKLQETSAKLADTEEALQETNAKLGDTEETLQETSAKLAETEETLQETNAKVEDTVEKLQETSAKLAETEETVQETSAKLAETEEKLQETSAKLAETEETLQETNAKVEDTVEKLQETSAKLAETEETVQETSAKLAETEETLQETSAKLADTEETLQETSAKLADTEETLQETSAKLAGTEETLQETSAKLAETEEALQETSAKLAETEEKLSAEISVLEGHLGVAHTLGQQQGMYIEQLMAYVKAAYNVTLDGLTEVQVTALTDMLRQCDYVVRSVAQAASDEVERVKEMYNMVDGNYKETAARLDILRRILGKIDQDVKEANVEIDGPIQRQSESVQSSSVRLGDVSNRENSMERKSVMS